MHHRNGLKKKTRKKEKLELPEGTKRKSKALGVTEERDTGTVDN